MFAAVPILQSLHPSDPWTLAARLVALALIAFALRLAFVHEH
jgi:hypothetical protein